MISPPGGSTRAILTGLRSVSQVWRVTTIPWPFSNGNFDPHMWAFYVGHRTGDAIVSRLLRLLYFVLTLPNTSRTLAITNTVGELVLNPQRQLDTQGPIRFGPSVSKAIN